MRPTVPIAAIALLMALIWPVQAVAGANVILKDCIDGSLNGNYSQSQLDKAKKHLPDDIAEYTNCLDALKGKKLDSLPSHPGARAKTASLGIDPAEVVAPPRYRQRLARATQKGLRPLKVNGTPVVAGSASPVFRKSGFILDVPWQIAVLMGLIALALLGGGVYMLHRHGLAGGVGRFFGR